VRRRTYFFDYKDEVGKRKAEKDGTKAREEKEIPRNDL